MSDQIKELVKRLRAKAHCCCGPHMVGKCSPCRAADAIELLVRQLNETDKAARAFYEKADTITKEADQELEDLHDALKVVLARAEKAEAEVERLKGALEARLSYHGLKGKCPCVDCREIRSALEAKP